MYDDHMSRMKGDRIGGNLQYIIVKEKGILVGSRKYRKTVFDEID